MFCLYQQQVKHFDKHDPCSFFRCLGSVAAGSSPERRRPQPGPQARLPREAADDRTEGEAGSREHDPEHHGRPPLQGQEAAGRGPADAAGLEGQDRLSQDEDTEGEAERQLEAARLDARPLVIERRGAQGAGDATGGENRRLTP